MSDSAEDLLWEIFAAPEERIRRRQELRRSNAARPHKSAKEDYDRNDKSWKDEE